jgi:glycosyltransferase involved in cell wall biosynthesis
MPEVFATKFNLPMDSMQVSIAKKLEERSVSYADFVFSTSKRQKEILIERTKKKDIAVIMNLPKKDIFKMRDMTDFLREKGIEHSFIVSFIGGLNPERELDIVIKAIKYVEDRIPNIAFIFCGTGEKHYLSSLMQLIVELNLQKKVIYMGYVPQDDVLNYVHISNVTLNPYKIHLNLNPVGSTKIFEYLMIPKPVIVPDYPGNRDEFKDLVIYYRSSDYKSMGDRILEVYRNEEKYRHMAKRAQGIIFKKYDPEKNEQNILKIYSRLITG